jgi:hypothetical protein
MRDLKDALAAALTARMEAKRATDGTTQDGWYRRTSAAIERQTGITLSASALETHAVGDNECASGTLLAYFQYFGAEFERDVRGAPEGRGHSDADLVRQIRDLIDTHSGGSDRPSNRGKTP